MKNNTMKKLLSLVLSLVLIAAAMLTTGCTPAEPTEPPMETFLDGDTLGEGAHSFTLIVRGTDESEAVATVHTDKETVGEALLELGIIGGDMSEYGIYIKTVNGETCDYETDGYFWAFYINGESAMTGVDGTAIADGAVYTLQAEAAAG